MTPAEKAISKVKWEYPEWKPQLDMLAYRISGSGRNRIYTARAYNNSYQIDDIIRDKTVAEMPDGVVQYLVICLLNNGLRREADLILNCKIRFDDLSCRGIGPDKELAIRRKIVSGRYYVTIKPTAIFREVLMSYSSPSKAAIVLVKEAIAASVAKDSDVVNLLPKTLDHIPSILKTWAVRSR